jgi:hypothetical protein
VIVVKLIRFVRKNGFVLFLLLAVTAIDLALAAWNPMETSRRFAKDDFTKTLYHHGWQRSGAVFYGNSAVTAAYIEEQSRAGLVEMGLSLGKITDLEQILRRSLYEVTGQLVIGIDVHTMLDTLPTDDKYPWLKPRFQPYLYYYRAYFLDAGKEFALNLLTKGSLAYQPRWIDKELYFGRKDKEWLDNKWNEYDQRFGWMTREHFRQNLAALEWVIEYAEGRRLPLKVVWMPWNTSYPKPPYMASLKQEVNGLLEARQIPVLDLMDRFEPKYFHDLVHLNREEGAPLFTEEVDRWLLSFEKSSK